MTKRTLHPTEVAERTFAAMQPGGAVEDRRRAICGHIEAIGREAHAEFLATKTNEPIEACIAMLASQPTDDQSTARRITANFLAGRRR